MPTYTTNYNLAKPLVNNPIDQDLWGDQLNADMDTIDAQLKVATDNLTRSISATGSVTSSDRNKLILADATSGTITVNLLSAATAGNGFTFHVKKTDASANTVVIDPDGSETIDGASTFVLSVENNAVEVISNGTNWYIGTYQNIVIQQASTTVQGIVELATTSEVQGGSDPDRAVTPSAMKGAIGFSKSFISSPQTITNGLTTSIPHGLGAVPVIVDIKLVCNTGQGGYSSGDIVQMQGWSEAGVARGASISADATNIYLTVASGSINILNRTTGGVFNITNANWSLIGSAWV